MSMKQGKKEAFSDVVSMDVDVRRICEAALLTPMGNSFGSSDGELVWGPPIVLHSGPGASKTSFFNQLAKKYGLSKAFVNMKPGARGEGAIGVVPLPVALADGRVVLDFPPPGELVTKFPDKRGLILVDDLATMAPALQPAYLDVLQERMLGTYRFGGGVRVFGATNSVEDSAGGWDIAPSVANRMGHLPWSDPSGAELGRFLQLRADRLEFDDEILDLAREEERVLGVWPDFWARASQLFAGFLMAHPEMVRKQPKFGDPNASKAWASPRCYDGETEVLTRRGFIRWPDVQDSDEFATIDPNGVMTYAKAVSPIFSTQYDGDMLAFQAQHVDLLVTPEHKMYVASDRRGGDETDERRALREEFALIEATQLLKTLEGAPTRALRMRSDADWIGRNDGPGKQLGSRTIPWEIWAEFVGWFATDGNTQITTNNQKIVRIDQTDPRDHARVGWLMSQLDCRHLWQSAKGWIGNDDDLYEELAKLGGKHKGERYVPRDIMERGPVVMRALLAGAVGGDGWFNKGTTMIGVGVCARLAADLQEAAVKSGGTGRVSTRVTKGYEDGGLGAGGTVVYEVHVMGKRYARPLLTRKNAEVIKNWKGTVYCATVEPYHTLLVRRNGHIAWCGNTIEYACRAYAGGLLHKLPASELNAFVGAFVGQSWANEFETYAVNADLPEPRAFLLSVLQEKPIFTHSRTRLDRTTVVLQACVALVSQPTCADRKELADGLWQFMHLLTDECADLLAPCVQSLWRAKMVGLPSARPVLAAMEPVVNATRL